jgi:pyoverdine/dityrosine biosynthesis protein Dit1
MLAICFAVGALAIYLFQFQKNTAMGRAKQIYEILDKYRITYDLNAHAVDPTFDTTPQPVIGVSECIQNIAKLITENRPLNLFNVGFPFKSINHEQKTFGDLPDMAERKALEYLQGILDALKVVYAPGAQMTIFCDGIAFAEFSGIPQKNVFAYENAMKRIAADLPDIKLFTSDEIMKKHNLSSPDDINTLFDSYGPGKEGFKDLKDPDVVVTRKRMAIEFDYEAGRKILETQSLDNIAVRLSAREECMRNYLGKNFPADQFLRLSMGFSADVSKKLGLRFSPDSEIKPNHGVLVEEKDNSWSIQFKKDIDMNDYVLMTKKINGVDCQYVRRK